MGLRLVGRYVSLSEAHAVRCALESGGIPAFVFDDYFGRIVWIEQMILGGFRVVVPEQDLADAKAFVDEVAPQGPRLSGGARSLDFWMCLTLATAAWGAGWSWVAYRNRPTPWRAAGFLFQFFGFLALDIWLIVRIVAWDLGHMRF